MPSFRERLDRERDEGPPSIVSAVDDTVPIVGAATIFPIIINANSAAPLGTLGVVGITSWTFVAVCLLLFAATSYRMVDYGRYVAAAVLVPVVFLVAAGLPLSTVKLFGLLFTVIGSLSIDLFGAR